MEQRAVLAKVLGVQTSEASVQERQEVEPGSDDY
jgi:hypothetical protein